MINEVKSGSEMILSRDCGFTEPLFFSFHHYVHLMNINGIISQGIL